MKPAYFLDCRAATKGVWIGLVFPLVCGTHDKPWDLCEDKIRPSLRKYVRAIAAWNFKIQGIPVLPNRGWPIGVSVVPDGHGEIITVEDPKEARKLMKIAREQVATELLRRQVKAAQS